MSISEGKAAVHIQILALNECFCFFLLFFAVSAQMHCDLCAGVLLCCADSTNILCCRCVGGWRGRYRWWKMQQCLPVSKTRPSHLTHDNRLVVWTAWNYAYWTNLVFFSALKTLLNLIISFYWFTILSIFRECFFTSLFWIRALTHSFLIRKSKHKKKIECTLKYLY